MQIWLYSVHIMYVAVCVWSTTFVSAMMLSWIKSQMFKICIFSVLMGVGLSGEDSRYGLVWWCLFSFWRCHGVNSTKHLCCNVLTYTHVLLNHSVLHVCLQWCSCQHSTLLCCISRFVFIMLVKSLNHHIIFGRVSYISLPDPLLFSTQPSLLLYCDRQMSLQQSIIF